MTTTSARKDHDNPGRALARLRYTAERAVAMRVMDIPYKVWKATAPPLRRKWRQAVQALDLVGTHEPFVGPAVPTRDNGSGTLTRPGQSKFRLQVLERDQQCIVTGTPVGTKVHWKGTYLPLVQAAHIKPHRMCKDHEYYDPDNGIALRVDIHAAFDAGLFAIHPDGTLSRSRWVLTQGLPHRILCKLTKGQQKYLAGHREWAFRNWDRWSGAST